MSEIKLIGVAGTAKNTGKTTTTMALMAKARQEKLKWAVTSIGLDGEYWDQITSLAKPKLVLEQNDLVLTTTQAIEASAAKLTILEELPLMTPLGSLTLAKVQKKGQVMIAGVSHGQGLKAVKAFLQQKKLDLLFVDGALSRMAPLMYCDQFILCTGAARQKHLPTLTAETKALTSLFTIEECSQQLLNQESYLVQNNEMKILPYSSLLTAEMVLEIVDYPKIQEIYLTGVLTFSAWKELLAKTDSNIKLKLKSPLGLLPVSNPIAIDEMRQLWLKENQLCVLKPLPLKAITVNPFYPKWHAQSKYYQEGYVDKKALQQSLANEKVPVFNVWEQKELLWQKLFA